MTKEASYLLSITVIVETMRHLQEPISLQAQLPPALKIWRDICWATIIIGGGTLRSCVITDKNGQLLLKQEEALRALEPLGDLKWYLIATEPAPEPIQPQERTNAAGDRRPRHIVSSLTPAQRMSLSRRHIQVFTLADGSRNVEKIAQLLRLSPQEVWRILLELQENRLIAIN